MLGLFRRPDPARDTADRLHGAIAARARDPRFYTSFGVPDTIDGRFDLLALHAFLVMDALKNKGVAADAIATQLATAIFAGFEDALRDIGITDFGLSRRIKAMGNAFYGRLDAYGTAEDEPAFAAALVRNLYRGDASYAPRAAVLARYALGVREHLAGSDILEGNAEFGPLPQTA